MLKSFHLLLAVAVLKLEKTKQKQKTKKLVGLLTCSFVAFPNINVGSAQCILDAFQDPVVKKFRRHSLVLLECVYIVFESQDLRQHLVYRTD